MADKKDTCRFTLQFNPADPQHLQTIQILNQQGRRKAQFLVNAVIHYLHCTETPSIPQPVPLDTNLIESIVQKILQERNEGSLSHMPNKAASLPERTTSSLSPPQGLGAERMAAITNSLASFRR